MLKITEQRVEESESMLLVLEGRLVGPWVGEVDTCWNRMAPEQQKRTVIDLSSVTFVDGEGKALLTRMWKTGATLRATGCLMRCLVEEITGVEQRKASCKMDEHVG
ncbi:conserved protein of unknown function [Nitrospira japonica]|uniref:STAS domain-containing protein n=1 Tax=Nitrospira japonica TaxID=1325564 RepID=A0A1W1I2I9_9BACT|nr:hypothetical protein [Nitrospira japonica]SLM47207.1 conserved protein of unknown function [Nitrospira japonica]